MPAFDDLFGTLQNFLRIGLTGPRLKNNSGNLQIRNTGDTAHAAIEASSVSATGDNIVINSDAAGSGNDWTLTLSRNAGQTAALNVTYPTAKGTDGHVLRQKAGTAAGVLELELAAAGTTSQCITVDTTTLAFGTTSPLTLFSTPNGAIIDSIEIIIDTPFNGTPTVSIGISGTTSKYVSSNQVDLTAAAATSFIIRPNLPSTAGEALIATYAAGGATAGSARILVKYVIPT